MIGRTQASTLDPAVHDYLNQLSAQLERTSIQVNTLERQQVVVSSEIQKIGGQLDVLSKKWEDANRPEWSKYGILIALLGLVIGPAAIFLTLYINSSVFPLKSDITQISTDLTAVKTSMRDLGLQLNSRDKDVSNLVQTTTVNASRLNELAAGQQRMSDLVLASQAADVNSRTDRERLNLDVRDLKNNLAQEIASRRAEEAAARVHRGEIETQFHAVSNLENLRWAHQNRLNSVLFNKTHPGESWPDTSFFPPTIFQTPSGGIPDGNLR